MLWLSHLLRPFSGLVKISCALLTPAHEPAVKMAFCAHLKVLAVCVRPYTPLSLSRQT